MSCAVREVLEEVGYDCSDKIRDEDFLEMQWQQQVHAAAGCACSCLDRPLQACRQPAPAPRTQVMRLYVVPGVPEETVFETRTKKEIGEIAWHKIKDLPTSKEDAQGKLKQFWCVHTPHARTPRCRLNHVHVTRPAP